MFTYNVFYFLFLIFVMKFTYKYIMFSTLIYLQNFTLSYSMFGIYTKFFRGKNGSTISSYGDSNIQLFFFVRLIRLYNSNKNKIQ